MRMQTAGVIGNQSFHFEPEEEITEGEPGVKSAGADEPRQVTGTDFMHCGDQTARHLDPVHDLPLVEGTLVLAELDRLLRLGDDRAEVISETPVHVARIVGIQYHELLLRPAALDGPHGVPRIMTHENRRRALGMPVADSVVGMEAVELVLEHGR